MYLLIGAGCSVSAGIPTAMGFVQIIQKDFPDAYSRADSKTYPRCMAQLTPGMQRDLIAREVDSAKINWGHIAIAQLMAAGYVDRVLTTNFDPLVVRACAMMGVFPAVYDFAASQLLKPDQVPDVAVFHLHGQRTGFVLMNTEEDCNEHAKRLGPLFDDAGRGRIWVVAGYSGENDPVFDHLARVANFDYGLYWIGYKDNERAEHVRKQLLGDGRGAFYVRGFDADRFFVELAQRLECFPPGFVARPFSHLEQSLDTLTPFPLPDGEADIDILEKPRGLIERAKVSFEAATTAAGSEAGASIDVSDLAAIALLMAGKYDEVEALDEGERSPIRREAIAWSRIAQGNALQAHAKTKRGDDADRLFKLAGEKYQAALDIKPDYHEALSNWGVALANQAKTKRGDDADRLFKLAGEKYQAALDIKPDGHEALSNWGHTIADQAKTKAGDEADRLFKLAYEKFCVALNIKPDYHEALNIKPDYHEALNNWGVALLHQAQMRSGERRSHLLNSAAEKAQ